MIEYQNEKAAIIFFEFKKKNPIKKILYMILMHIKLFRPILSLEVRELHSL